MPTEPDRPTRRPGRPFSNGLSLVALIAFASPGLIAGAVVWPLLRDRWRPIAAIVLGCVTLLSLGLAGAVGWLDRRKPPEASDPTAREPGSNHRERT